MREGGVGTGSPLKSGADEQKQPLLQNNNMIAGINNISYIGGTIDRADGERFKKMVYRATRGKALTYSKDLEQASQTYSGEKDKRTRTVYVIVFQDGTHTRDKLNKICDSFVSQRFDIPSSNTNSLNGQISSLEQAIINSNEMITQTRKRLREYLKQTQDIS